jgi:hypothetical protein
MNANGDQCPPDGISHPLRSNGVKCLSHAHPTMSTKMLKALLARLMATRHADLNIPASGRATVRQTLNPAPLAVDEPMSAFRNAFAGPE